VRDIDGERLICSRGVVVETRYVYLIFLETCSSDGALVWEMCGAMGRKRRGGRYCVEGLGMKGGEVMLKMERKTCRYTGNGTMGCGCCNILLGKEGS
jgi:hypothetical protein